MSQNIYLVAGATRGIGLALVAEIAAKEPSAIIYAGGRNIEGAPKLDELAKKYPGRIEIVKYIAADQEGNEALAKKIREKHGHVDTVIANAAIGNNLAKVHEVSIAVYEEQFKINTVGPIVLFQAFYDLLKASPFPRFIAISSGGGSIENIATTPFDLSPYGMSKAALNWVVRKIHYENEWLVAFPQCPGLVDTDMSREAGAIELVSKLPGIIARQPEEAADILLDIITTSTREKDGGQFHNIERGRHSW